MREPSRSSLCHGAPPHINQSHFNVPLPKGNDIVPHGFTDTGIGFASPCFIALCSLTKVLGNILSHIYDLSPLESEVGFQKLRDLRTNLDEWQKDLPPELASQILGDGAEVGRGVLNLKLSFLALDQLLCRLTLNVSKIIIYNI